MSLMHMPKASAHQDVSNKQPSRPIGRCGFLCSLIYLTMYRMTDLPLDPEMWRGSDEWAELADARRHINEQRQLEQAEDAE